MIGAVRLAEGHLGAVDAREAVVLPEGGLLLGALVPVAERVQHGGQEGAVVLPTGAGDLGDTVLSEVNVVVLGQVETGVARVPQVRVDEHHGGLEHVEVPLEAQGGMHMLKVFGRLGLLGAEVLDDAVDAADRDEQRRCVHGDKRLLGGSGQDSSLGTALVEADGHAAEAGDDAHLDDQRGLEHDVANVCKLLANGRVGDPGNADAVEDLDETGHGAESGQGSARVHGRVVWHVV